MYEWKFFKKVDDLLVLKKDLLGPLPTKNANFPLDVIIRNPELRIFLEVHMIFQLDQLALKPILELAELGDPFMPSKIQLHEQSVVNIEKIGLINQLYSPLTDHQTI